MGVTVLMDLSDVAWVESILVISTLTRTSVLVPSIWSLHDWAKCGVK